MGREKNVHFLAFVVYPVDNVSNFSTSVKVMFVDGKTFLFEDKQKKLRQKLFIQYIAIEVISDFSKNVLILTLRVGEE